MKNYQKPAMLVLSISANDALCACSIKPGSGLFDDLIGDWGIQDVNMDGKISKADFADGYYFTRAEESCGEPYKVEVTEYCKFTGSQNVLFTS